jgi:hypothetical protein
VKRLLISIAVAFFLLLLLTAVGMISGMLANGDVLSPDPAVAWTTALPRLIYRTAAPDLIQDRLVGIPGVESLLFFAGNLVLYSALIYGLITLFAGSRSRA